MRSGEKRCFAAENRAQTRSLFLLRLAMPSDAGAVASRARAEFVAEFVAVSFRQVAAASLLPSKSDSLGCSKPRRESLAETS